MPGRLRVLCDMFGVNAMTMTSEGRTTVRAMGQHADHRSARRARQLDRPGPDPHRLPGNGERSNVSLATDKTGNVGGSYYREPGT